MVSRADITAHVWDENHDPFSNALEVYVGRLRKKVDEGAPHPLIYTRRGAGYVLADPDDAVGPDGGPFVVVLDLRVRSRAAGALADTTVLAVLLVAVAAGAYAFVVRSVRARTDAALADALADLRTQLGAEGGERMSTRSVVVEVLQDMRFRTTALVVYDSAGRGFASSIPRPRPQAADPPAHLRCARAPRQIVGR